MQRPSTIFDRWDVALSLFPFVDLPEAKLRPVLVLSAAAFNDSRGVVVAGMITSGAHTRWPSDHAIVDLEAAGLDRPSVFRLKLFTIPVTPVVRRLGHLSEADQQAITSQLSVTFPQQTASD